MSGLVWHFTVLPPRRGLPGWWVHGWAVGAPGMDWGPFPSQTDAEQVQARLTAGLTAVAI